MSYPQAYCVKCREYTDPSSKQTVLLKNSARALKGVCAKCESDVYLIMPKKDNKSESKPENKGDARTVYSLDKVFRHTAYCVKCRKQTNVNYGHGIIFSNGRKALRGQCESCGCDAYKILKERIIIRDVSHSRRLSNTSAVTAADLIKTNNRSKTFTVAFLIAFAVMAGAAAAVLLK